MSDLDDWSKVTCSRGVQLVANTLIHDCLARQYDLICLPGGMPGATRLQECGILREIVTHHAAQSHLIGAICASPAVVLNKFGLLGGKTVTCYPAAQFRG
jgi:protein deglycase